VRDPVGLVLEALSLFSEPLLKGLLMLR